MISKDKFFLRIKSEPVTKKSEGFEIGRKLTSELERYNRKAGRKNLIEGVGLAAPQIGISKQVCVIKPESSMCVVLVNPRIVCHSNTKVPFEEGCLSFPGISVQTYRWNWVEIHADNWGTICYGKYTENKLKSNLFESVLVQHEIAHLYGLLMFDFTKEEYPDFSEWTNWRPE